MSQRRRVSYVIPPPESSASIARLQFPPLGANSSRILGTASPLLLTSPNAQRTHKLADGSARRQHHPRHRLGIGALALDSSTQLYGKSSPQGILYSGGRDGLVLSWDLGLPMKAKAKPRDNHGKKAKKKWEAITGWDDDEQTDEDEGTEIPVSDGDVLGDVTSPATMRRRRQNTFAGVAKPQFDWELDRERMLPRQVRNLSSCTASTHVTISACSISTRCPASQRLDKRHGAL